MKIKLLLLVIVFTFTVRAQTIKFEDLMNGNNTIADLQGRGWVILDEDGGGDTPAWFQGNDSIIVRFEGPVDGFVAANFAGANANGVIDQWLISPGLNVEVGDSLAFYARSPFSVPAFDDSIDIMFAQNAGTIPSDFVSLRRFLVPTDDWNLFYVTFNLNATVRFAVRYYIFDGGELGSRSNYIGLDKFQLFSAGGSPTYPATINLSKTFTFVDATQSSSYRMIGLPGNVGVPITQFTGSAQQRSEWNLFHDNGATINFYEEFNGTEKFNFGNGRGFWVLSRNPININREVNTLSLEDDNTYSIDLHNGWNILTNPFEKSINVSDIRNSNPTLQVNAIFYSFNGNFQPVTVTNQYEGYYLNNENNLDVLKIPYPFGTNLPKINDEPYVVSEKNISLNLSSSEFSSEVKIGIDESSKNGYDYLDYFAPPGNFEELNIRLVNENLSTSYKQLFIEHRPKIGEGQVFNLEIKNETDKPLILSAEGLEKFDNYEVYLLDERLNKFYNLHEQKQVEISPIHQKNNYSLLIGKSSFINSKKDNLLPKEFSLYQNYPNPFNPATVISWQLPVVSHVLIKIYDILGNEVNTLVNEELSPGIYEVEFDGSNLSSGMYIYEIYAGNFREIKKMSLIK